MLSDLSVNDDSANIARSPSPSTGRNVKRRSTVAKGFVTVTLLVVLLDCPGTIVSCHPLKFVHTVVTCEMHVKLFQNYFATRRHQSEIILFQCVQTRLKVF